MFTQVLIEWKIQVWSCLLVDWCVFWFKIHLTQTNLFCSCVHLLCSMHCAYVTIRRDAQYTATSLCGFLFFILCCSVFLGNNNKMVSLRIVRELTNTIDLIDIEMRIGENSFWIKMVQKFVFICFANSQNLFRILSVNKWSI